jgi:hypothetical protein
MQSDVIAILISGTETEKIEKSPKNPKYDGPIYKLGESTQTIDLNCNNHPIDLIA